ncbi:DUF934 domain-containing protein [Vogesella oryzae]|uniref:DUF934 domain-containing protein n=1 Tax=Vogesella oryzae TaxID=1735285 RepID=UPI0015815CB0|nr:DUF934 domain-containing protein [Vogesella oryzae]
MQNLIKHGVVVADDNWRLLRDEEAEFAADENVILPLSRFLQVQGGEHCGALAVLLAPDSDPLVLQPHLASLTLIAIDFPAFADGRGYSIARLLRERLAFKGELRAVGDVLRDQLSYMAQVGFDSFAIREDRSAAEALEGLADFSEQYQGTVLQPVPLLKRRVPN